MKNVPRVVAEPSCGVARHGGNATVPVCADTAMHARTDSQNTEGGAGWAEHLRWAALESGSVFFWAITCFYRSGSARPRAGWVLDPPPIRRWAGFLPKR